MDGGVNASAQILSISARFGMLHEVSAKDAYFAPVCNARHLSVRHYNWEPSRYLGDGTHILALITCIMALLRDDGPDGVSMKAHMLFLLVFSVRFANIFLCEQPVYLIIYKVMLWTTTLKIVMLLAVRGSAQDGRDTMPVMAMLFSILIITCVCGSFSLQDHGLVVEVLWTYSNYIEVFAMLPQYVYSYRDRGNRSLLVYSYVVLMGGYRIIFGIPWLTEVFLSRDRVVDVSSLLSGFLGVAFFADFLKFHATGISPMSSACIAVDNNILDAEEAALELARGGSFHDVVCGGASNDASGRTGATVMGRPAEVELHFYPADDQEIEMRTLRPWDET